MKQATPNINGKTYVINQFQGEEGWEYLAAVTKYILPVASYMLGGYKVDEDNKADQENKLEAQFTKSFSELMSGENRKEFTQLVKDLVRKVEVDSQAINFNREFAGNYDVLIKLVWEVIKLNYESTFQNLVSGFNPQ